MKEQKTHARTGERGFSLVELIVAVGLFAIVMLVSVTALLALVDANRKARSLESVINNLNIALDGMVRAMRMGSTYHCVDGSGVITEPQDCSAGTAGTAVAFEAFGGDSDDPNDQVIYSFETDPTTDKGRLYRSLDSGASKLPVTAPDIVIEDMKFYVIGSARGDTVQPKMVITVRGTAGAGHAKTRTTFQIQATAAQRVLDI